MIAVFFCDEKTALYAGEGTAKVEDFRINVNNKRPPQLTPFDQTVSMNEMKRAGIKYFVKVPATKENAEIYQKYRVGINTLVIMASNGDILDGLSASQLSQSNVTALCKRLPEHLAAWQKKQGG